MSILYIENPTRRIIPALVIVVAAGTLAGCSSTMSRFNFPVFGLNETKNQSQPTSAYAGTSGYGSQGYSNSQYGSKTSANGNRSGTSYRKYSDNGSSITRSPIEPVQQPKYQTGTGNNSDLSGPKRVASIDKKPSYNFDNYGAGSSGGYYGSSGKKSYTQNTSGESKRITVQSGDTLYSISQRYGVPVGSIKSANSLKRDSIRVGQVLLIPSKGYAGGEVYRVRSGDTIHSIARQYGVNSSELAANNSLRDPSRLKVGQLLRLPEGAVRRSANNSDIMPEIRSVRTQKIPVNREKPKNGTRIASINSNDIPGTVNKSQKRSGSSEGQRVAGIGNLPKPKGQSSNSFRWPVRGRIISKYGPKSSGSHNDGVNLAVPMGTPVKAAQQGVVAYSGNELKGYGNLILIRHSNNWVSAYAHNSELLVKRGDRIKRGQVIAKSGKSGSVGQPQLHFELRKGSKPVDPIGHMEPL